MRDARTSWAKEDIRKVLWYLKLVSPVVEDNSLIGSIVAKVIAKELEKWKERSF